MARWGKQNGRYKDGGRLDYRARVGLSENEGGVVHHKNGKRTGLANNRRSNLQVLPAKPGANSSSRHERIHRRAARKR
jgi:hypothetical protein